MRVLVHTPQGLAGRLQRSDGHYVFTFDPAANADMEPALGMPLRALPYARPTLHPVFQMNLPEGFVLDQIRLRLAKTGVSDPLLLLNVIGSQAPIGRLHFNLEGEPAAMPSRPGERLADLLASRGSKALFSRLVDDYVLSSGLSGVQPKVLVPEDPAGAVVEKAALATSDLIVKSGLDIYPGLAINEFFCMSVVERAGVKTPPFYLSDDGELFIMRRFDRPSDGRILGFEDMLSLAGRDTEQKYAGSYANILKLLRFYCSPSRLTAAKQQLFDMLALSCILGNGDAHMKNFGVLYEGVHDEVSMAPAYDIVCTRLYIPEDTLALTLDGNKSFFAARQGLREFGRSCDIAPAAVDARLAELAQLTLDMLEEKADTVARLSGLREVIETEARLYLESFK
ncbi:MAG TPA: type II toxin-antitoxin system HipA family toxin [Burkholderiaceae bacterium]|jgi:serine/threonine-protein kinase HipA